MLASRCTGKADAFPNPRAGSCCMVTACLSTRVSKDRQHPRSFQRCSSRLHTGSSALSPAAPAAARGRAQVNAGELTLSLCCHGSQHQPGEVLVPGPQGAAAGAGWPPATLPHLTATGFAAGALPARSIVCQRQMHHLNYKPPQPTRPPLMVSPGCSVSLTLLFTINRFKCLEARCVK